MLLPRVGWKYCACAWAAEASTGSGEARTFACMNTVRGSDRWATVIWGHEPPAGRLVPFPPSMLQLGSVLSRGKRSTVDISLWEFTNLKGQRRTDPQEQTGVLHAATGGLVAPQPFCHLADGCLQRADGATRCQLTLLGHHERKVKHTYALGSAKTISSSGSKLTNTGKMLVLQKTSVFTWSRPFWACFRLIELGRGAPLAHSQGRQKQRLTECTVLTGTQPEPLSLFIHTDVCLLREKGQPSSSPERKQKSQQAPTGTDWGLSD